MNIRYPFIDKDTSNKFLPIVTKYQRKAKTMLLVFAMNKTSVAVVSVAVASLSKAFKSECEKAKIEHLDIEKYARELFSDTMAWYLFLSSSFNEAKNSTSSMMTIKKALKLDTEKEEKKIDSKMKLIEEDKITNIDEIVNFYTGEYGQLDGVQYAKELQDRVEELANNEFKSSEGRSFFAQAELDLRHDIQLERLDDIYDELGLDNPVRNENAVVDTSKAFNEDGSLNVDTLRWLSSHKDCSERCSKWQGKLVSLVLPAINDKLETGYKINHHKIYSFIAIENQVDKYGYKNNIINGFNCRHHLLKFQDEALVPEKFTKKEIELSRKLNAKQRELEREIRHLKDLLDLEIKANNTRKIALLKKKIKIKISQYKEFCKKNNLVIELKRI